VVTTSSRSQADDGTNPDRPWRGVSLISGIYYCKLVFDYECYCDNPRVKVAEVPVATSVTGRVVSLPVHPALSTGELDTSWPPVRDLMKA
jgi:perosamine synthetase